MPAMASFTIADGESTPVNHTFDPLLVNGAQGLAHWIEHASSPYHIGKNFARVQRNLPPAGAVVRRVNVVLGMPKLLDVPTGGMTGAGYSPGPKVDNTMYFNGQFVLPLSFAEQDFINLRTLAKNLIGNVSAVNLAVTYGEASW